MTGTEKLRKENQALGKEIHWRSISQTCQKTKILLISFYFYNLFV